MRTGQVDRFRDGLVTVLLRRLEHFLSAHLLPMRPAHVLLSRFDDLVVRITVHHVATTANPMLVNLKSPFSGKYGFRRVGPAKAFCSICLPPLPRAISARQMLVDWRSIIDGEAVVGFNRNRLEDLSRALTQKE